jgi:gliding motility-associated-like protein
MRFSFAFLMLFLVFKGFSQSSTFTIDRTRTCLGSMVNVTVNLGLGDSGHQIDYENKGDGTFNNPCNCLQKSHIYSKSGIFQVEMAFSPNTLYPPLSGPLIKVTVNDTVTVKNSNLLSAYGCTGQKGIVTVNDPSKTYDYYEINWGDANVTTVSGAQLSVKDHPYADTIPKTVTIYGRIDQGAGIAPCGSNLPYTTVVYPLKSLTAAGLNQILVNNQDSNNGRLTVTFTSNQTMRYKIFQKTGLSGTYSATPIYTIEFQTSPTNFTIGGLNTVANRYCYKIVPFDACGSTLEPLNEICSTNLSASADATGNTVVWGSYPSSGSVPYDLYLNNALITSMSVPSTGEVTYLDENVRCKLKYCYQVVAKRQAAGFISISDTVCVIGEKPSSIAPVTNFNSSYENGGMKLFWDPSTFPGVTYRMYKSNVNGGDTTILDTTSSTSKVLKDKSSKCYAIRIKELCGESSLKVSCPIQLTGQKDNIVQNSLNWSGEYLNGDSVAVVDYTVEQYNENGDPLKSESQGTSVTFIHNPIDTVNQKVLYRIKGTLTNGSIVYSDLVAIIQDLRLYVPGAFTPNNDGLNDTFYAKGLFWDEFELAVYNRWGEVVFSSSDKSKSWDGGVFSPGLYHCVARVKDKYGNSQSWKHTLTLIR